MKPTEEEIKRFWEWCGFKYLGDGRWLYPDGVIHWQSPPFELNDDRVLGFFFKWAVPKVTKKHRIEIMIGSKGCSVYIYKYGEDFSVAKCVAEKPPLELSLFWAINEVITEGNMIKKPDVMSEQRIAEVEQTAARLIREFTNSQLGGISREAYLIQQAKAEEAREIFEEIEKQFSIEGPSIPTPTEWDRFFIIRRRWQSLKSKYLEGK